VKTTLTEQVETLAKRVMRQIQKFAQLFTPNRYALEGLLR
jgi:hypothetical protein